MDAERVTFTAERETSLFTLYGKALQSASDDPILPDPWAEDAVRHIDYDFGKLKVHDYESRIIAIRSYEFDQLTRRFIDEHAGSVVLQLGCGLDSRVFRVDPPKTVSWFDMDFPDVVELRGRLLPERMAYTMIGGSVEDLDWLKALPADQPALVVAEGLMMYLDEATVRSLLNGLTGHFPSGRIVFDAWNQLSLRGAQRRGIKDTGATFGWAIDDPRAISDLDGRLRLEREITAVDLDAFDKMPGWSRVVSRLMDPVTSLRRANRIIVCDF